MITSTQKIQETPQLQELISDIDSGMLTTINDDGSLQSRPMFANGEIDSDGTLWLFTYASSHKVIEIQHHQQVNISFASDEKQRYVSISGTAQLVKDRHKLQQLWKPKLQTWFPQGIEEPDIALLKINIQKVDYWDSGSCFKPQTIS